MVFHCPSGISETSFPRFYSLPASPASQNYLADFIAFVCKALAIFVHSKEYVIGWIPTNIMKWIEKVKGKLGAVLHSFPSAVKDKKIGDATSPNQCGTPLVVWWLRLCAPNAGGPGSIPGQGARSYMQQWRFPRASIKMWHNLKKKKKIQTSASFICP